MFTIALDLKIAHIIFRFLSSDVYENTHLYNFFRDYYYSFISKILRLKIIYYFYTNRKIIMLFAKTNIVFHRFIDLRSLNFKGIH